MATAYTDQVQKVYIAYYGRAADPVGLTYWAAKVETDGLAGIMAQFGASAEATTLYGSLSANAKVNALYQQNFGRDADFAGLMYYAGELSAGTMTAVSIAQNIFDGAAGTDATILANKLVVAKAYTAAIDTASEVIAYSGTVAAASARALLTTVDAATVTASFDVATSVASIVTTANATAVVSGSVFALTNSATTSAFDNFSGTAGNDTFQALAFDSLEDGDTVAGGAGADTLIARFDASGAGATALTSNTTISAVETINLTVSKSNHGSDALTFDAASVTGVTSIVAKDDSSAATDDVLYTINNLAAGVSAGVSGGTTGAGAGVTVAYKTTTGIADAETFTIANTGLAGVVTIAGIETLTVNATGTGNSIGALTAAAATTINVSGSGAVSILDVSGSTAVKTLDASTSTGKVTLGAAASTINNAVTKAVGGSGDDSMVFTASQIASTDTIDGGAGTDSVNLVGGALGTAHAAVKGFETLTITDVSTTYDLSMLTGSTIATVNASSTGGTVAVTNMTGQPVSMSGSAASTVTLAAKTAASTLALTLDNGTAKQASGVDVTTLVATNATTLDLTSNDDKSSLTGTNTNSVGAVQVVTVNVAATAPTAVTLTGTKTKTVDGSASTGALTIDGSSGFADSTTKVGMSITTGSGKDTVTGTAQNDTIITGAGNDSVVDSAGADTITLGAGDDSIVFSYANLTSTDTVNGGEGTDTLFTSALASAANFDLTGANSSKLSGVTSVEKIGMDITALTGTQTATLTVDDATLSVASNALIIDIKPNASAVTGAIATVDASAVVLSSGTLAISEADFGSKINYSGGNATETISLGIKVDTVTYGTATYLSGSDTISGGTGADALVFSGTTAKTITASQMTGLTSIGTINLDGVTAANANVMKITLTDAVATAMAESSALTITSLNVAATPVQDDTGKITVDGSAVSSAVALTITGGLGVDTLKGGAGADVISGGTAVGTVGGSADTLTGGAGKDDFVLTLAQTTIDTITDMDFGTATTTVDQIKLTGLSFNSGKDVVETDVVTNTDTDVLILATKAYADVAAVDVAVEALAGLNTAANSDMVILWQDTFGAVHFSQAVGATGANAGADNGDEYAITDLGTMTGIGITGVKTLIDIGDFIL